MSFANKFFRQANNIRSICFRLYSPKNDDSINFRPLSTKIEIPSPPKKPLTAYMIFCKESRQELLKEDPSLKSTQQIKVLAEKWRLLTPQQKKPYEDLAREKTILYGVNHKDFYENLSDEQRLELSRIKEEKRRSRKLFKLKKALVETDMPCRPRSAYVIYIQSQSNKRKELNEPGKSLSEIAKMWASMSEDEKQPFHEQSTHEKEQYEAKMKDWANRLIQDGKSNLLETYNEIKKLKTLNSIIDIKINMPHTKSKGTVTSSSISKN